MAELDFSHNVSEIPAGQALPQAVQRQEKAEVIGTPDIQSAVAHYADETNFMSTLGANVAAKASSAVAQKIGANLGKNPQGDIGIPLTDFDKTMQDSYKTQAQATLGLQANKLISDSNLEAAKAPRVTPELISKTNKSISIGLQQILQHAPSDIIPDMELHYGSLQQNQANELTRRMISEQHEDRRNNTALASQTNAENAYSFGLHGDEKSGAATIASTHRMNQADANVRLLTPEQVKSRVDTVRQSYLSGKMIHDYENSTNKEAYLKSIADKKPDYLSDADYMSVTQNLLGHVNRQESLREENAQLNLTKFKITMSERLAQNEDVTPAELLELKNNVSAVQFAHAQLDLMTAKSKSSKSEASQTLIANNWSNAEVTSRGSAEAVNGAFNNLVNKQVTFSQQQGKPITEAEAQLQVALTATVPVKSYTNLLNNKILNGTPQEVEEAGLSIEKMYSADKGQNLKGLDVNALAIYEKMSALRNNKPLPEALDAAKEIVIGKTPEQHKANDEAWVDYLKKRKQSGTSDVDFYLGEAGLDKNTFVRNGELYARQIKNTEETYFKLLNGDSNTAKKITKRLIDQTYGYTTINGLREFTYLPINKVLNLPDEANGVIQTDMATQISEQLKSTNTAYDEKKSDWKWVVKPQITIDDAIKKFEVPKEFSESLVRKKGAQSAAINYYNTQNKVEVIKLYRNGHSEKFTATLQANPYSSKTLDPNMPVIGGWEVQLIGKNGMEPLHTLDPRHSLITYRPNVQSVKDNFAKLQAGMGE